MAFYLNLFTPETWDAFRRHGGQISGFRDRAMDPDGISTVLSVLTANDGARYADIPASKAGKWRVRVSCSGPVGAADEVSFEVLASTVL